MTEASDTPAPEEGSPEIPATEDERRQKAAEVNRKRTEEAWLRNKKSWIDDNFPDKRKSG